MRNAEAKRTSDMSKATQSAKLRVVRDQVSSRRKRKTRRVRFRVPVAEPARNFDPLFDRKQTWWSGRIPAYVVASLLIHAGLFWGLTAFDNTKRTILKTERPEKVTVRMVQPSPPKRPVPNPAPAPLVEPTMAPKSTPVAKKQAVERPLKRTPRKPVNRAPRVATPDVPVDPIDIPNVSEPPAGEPRRRIVGLSFESTVKGGDGPAFAVDNTRMGTTVKLAEEGSKISPIAGRAYRPGAKTPNGNRVAAAIPETGVSLVKPKRLKRSEPAYPKILRAQGIEGNVAVLIRIDKSGQVQSVKVVKGSGYVEFDEAAKSAALNERFSPALRGDEPIEYTLKYTYRFRVKAM